MQRFRSLLTAIVLMTAVVRVAGTEEAVAVERYEVFSAGNVTYSNVVIMNKTKTDVFFRHVGGFGSVKVKDLDKTTQLQLGYHLILDAPPGTPKVEDRNALSRFELDPRLEELYEQAVWESTEYWNSLDRNTQYGAMGGVAFLYLFFCFCCHLIVRKTGLPTSLLVWLPWLKLLPLLRAAGMRPWWFITTILPGINVITYLVWSFKIARARGKGAGTSLMLLLPVFNVLAFLYLAFADRLHGDESANTGPRKIVTLSQPPRRNAA